MPFKPPQWTPPLQNVPDSVSIPDFMLDEKHGRRAIKDSRPPLVCGISGEAPSTATVRERVEHLAGGLAGEFGWQPNEGIVLDKVTCIFSINTVVHRLGGVVTPASYQVSASELTAQLKGSRASSIFTCPSLIETALKAATAASIPRHRVYLLEPPAALSAGITSTEFKSTSQLARLGANRPKVKPLKWIKGQGKRQIAFLCYSSGTSGLPKGVMISHYNVIASIMQVCTFEQPSRDQRVEHPENLAYTETVLGLLPLSHIYGLVMISHCAIWRGDSVVILPKFELRRCLQVIQDHKINTLFLVPPIIILMMKNRDLMGQYKLNSVKTIFTGAAPLAQETAHELAKMHPTWLIRQAYGLTETCSVVSSSADFDIWLGSSGSLITGVEARIVSLDGNEITGYGQPGEFWVKAPCLVLGYLNNEMANKETFVTDDDGDTWMRTGDEVVFKKSPRGHDHVFVVDRIKELIKVKVRTKFFFPFSDCAVIPVPDDAAGEVPKAFIVKSRAGCSGKSEETIRETILVHVKQHKSQHKWLRGGIEFIDVIPKSPSGKILRRVLKDREQQDRKRSREKI
ncbi:hypothetical protein ZTR_10640 [Talaromyces verruculosus]|nr:hypothetical protein ZTR_10640 [Talaromyces verruculosus]